MITKFNDYINESKKENHLPIDKWVQDLDPHINGTLDDKIKPMFSNLPNRTIRPSYDPLKAGQFVEINGITGQIIGMKNDKILVDVINDDNEHDIKEFDIKDVIKKGKPKK